MASVTKQLPPQHDLEFVAGNPFTVTVTSTGGTITSPVVTMRTGGGDAYTTDPGIPTVSQASAVTTIAFSAADTAALNTDTRIKKTYRWSLQALVNGAGPYELVARHITVHPVGSSIAAQAADDVALTITVGGVDIALEVTVGDGGAQVVNTQTGTTYAFVLADHTKLVTGNNGSASTYTVPASVFTPGQWFDVLNLGAGALTVTAGVGVTFAPAGDRVLTQNESTSVICYATDSFAVQAATSMSAAAILAALITVDGAGSGLDADTLDGTSSAGFATAAGLSDHLADTSVHGIADTSLLITGIRVEEEGTPTVATATALNFVGSTVTVTDAGSGEATVTIAGGAGDVATDAIFDAKGDLAVGTGANTAAKLTVGSNGQLAVAHSTATTGLIYSSNPGMIHSSATLYQVPLGVDPAVNFTQNAALAQYCFFWPCFAYRAMTIGTIASYCFTLEAGSQLRVGLYDSSTNLVPVNLLADYGTLSGASTGAKTVTGSTVVPPGHFFIAVWTSNHSTVRWLRAGTSAFSPFGATLADGRIYQGWFVNGVDYSSALPATAPALTIQNSVTQVNAVLPHFLFT